ncbi:26S proteasome non-ATPase regulatory subunit 8 isoform X2 [Physeter macrocephalus]|uniref:26S proteasome non-ATPase regulatory subunit 8 n=1 Tax=Physeter macrocephalus TaxID=9755 RepID=A0A455AEY6_PHYMC|nr:26S proteasome non-ATPase regulatory subunit 8 isoform X2 [Physeter catodon]|eukprot:XP_028333964.1 26S proteasome non-ATPase regulatory subunit 8 isoform X2 [Physeter catodon]
MFLKSRAPRAPPRELLNANPGRRRRTVAAPPPALGSTSRLHFRRARRSRRRCRKSGGRFAASRKMAAAAVNGVAGASSSGPAAASGAVLQAAAGMYEQLKGEWNRKSPNLSKCGEELGRLKLVLLELNFLPTTGTKLTKQQLILARDILEIGAQWSILRKDIPSFERYMAQLKCYYFDYKEQLPESAYMHQLLGLNLLFLLSQNRVAEFHTELERLPAKDIQTNYLMEGSYNKVFLAKGNIPAESYTFFIDILLDTIRDEIAGCIEKAYEKILFTEATRILFFNTPKKMTDYAKKRGWVLGLNNYYSFASQQQKPEDTTIPSTELAKQVIEYARQLEMIV